MPNLRNYEETFTDTINFETSLFTNNHWELQAVAFVSTADMETSELLTIKSVTAGGTTLDEIEPYDWYTNAATTRTRIFNFNNKRMVKGTELHVDFPNADDKNITMKITYMFLDQNMGN